MEINLFSRRGESYYEEEVGRNFARAWADADIVWLTVIAQSRIWVSGTTRALLTAANKLAALVPWACMRHYFLFSLPR